MNNPYFQAEICPLKELEEMEISIDESQIYHMMYNDEDESDSVQGPVQEDENDSNETIQVPRPVMRCNWKITE